VPTVVIGPGSIEQAHTRDEWVRLDELTKAADIFIELSVTADRYLSAHEHASGAGSVKR
jgi:acetylornithine deacetylase/succinyl-diaminopimelate desuccinylase-like protein